MRIRRLVSLPVIFALGRALTCHAADWLNDRGDAQLSGWQKREKTIDTSNVKDLKLIWTLQLDAEPGTPVILGHWITNRGTKELLFAVTASRTVYAVDADLGRLFWQRQLSLRRTATPPAIELAPGPSPPPGQTEVDDDDDVRQTLRPIYVQNRNGRRYRLHPTTGADLPADTTSDLASTHNSHPATAYWEARWTFTAGASNVIAAQGGRKAWTSPAMISPAPPVVANGIVYALSRGSKSTHATLYAFEAKTGRQLFSSQKLIASYVTASGLAIANGHVCFGTHDGTLRCFGFPVDL